MRKSFKYLCLALTLSLGQILALGALGIGFVPVAHASSCTVGTSHVSIQAAVSDSNCDLIIIPSGTYLEHITINRSLTLQGAGANSTFIDGGGSGRVVNITAGTVLISGVTVQNGKLTGAGVGSIGAGILNLGKLTLTNTTVSSNTADQGSGIYTYLGVLTLTNSTVSSNEGPVFGSLGSAIFEEYSTLIMNNSTVSGNKGGGIVSVGGGTLTLNNSTVSGNEGGGIANWSGTLTLNSSTVSNNTEGAGILGGGILKNTIVANNGGGAILISTDCSGAVVTSAGYNLDSDNTCNLTTTSDITDTDPLLGLLQDNGGATETHALLLGSPAIDTGSCSVTTTDQRGKHRPIDIPNIANADNGCDIGAYETQTQLTLTKAVDNQEPAQGQQINYIITVNNSGDINATNALISDTLPVSITFAGSVMLDPDQPNAIRATSALSLPTLASNVTITPQTTITLTVPVTVNLVLTETTTPIINTAAVTSIEISTPATGSVRLGGTNIYLPIVLKNP